MDDTTQTIAYRLTITVDGVELPVDEEMRHALLDDLRVAVRDRIGERHGVEVDQDDITIATGYRYAQVPAECPLCSERLDLLSVHLNNENGAYASAKCSDEDCEWSGDAVYRIIDLDPGDTFEVEKTFPEVSPDDYDALVVPGGSVGADQLRADGDAVDFVREFIEAEKPAGVICHGPWTLVEGRTLTSFPSLQTDIRNAGGEWVNEEVVVDEGLVTSRKPDDIPAFCDKIIEEFEEGRH